MTKNIHISENICMFAVPYITKSGQTALNLSGFFISNRNITGYNTPSYQLNGDTALRECKAEGKVVPLFILQPQQTNISDMPYTEKTCLQGNNSTYATTPNGATTVTLTPEFLEDYQQLVPYNQEYGFVITNLFRTLKNQLGDLYEIAENFDDNEHKMNMLNTLWQVDTLIDVIREKSNTDDLFFHLDNLTYRLKEILTPKNI